MSQSGSVFVSRAGARTWERDDDVGGAAHMVFDLGATKAGLWRAGPEGAVPAEVGIPARETVLVLEGSVRVSIDRGDPYDLRVGDMLSIPAGAMVGWDASTDCLVFWVYS